MTILYRPLNPPPTAATHWLRCKQGLGRGCYLYDVACLIEKDMGDGRSRVRVLTDRNGADVNRVRYVENSRLEEISESSR